MIPEDCAHVERQTQARGDLPASRGAYHLDPGRGGLGAQCAGAGRGHLDAHPGHCGSGRAEQADAEFLWDPGRNGDAVWLVEQVRQRARPLPGVMQQPDRHRAVPGVVGKHDQEAGDEELAVADLPGHGLACAMRTVIMNVSPMRRPRGHRAPRNGVPARPVGSPHFLVSGSRPRVTPVRGPLHLDPPAHAWRTDPRPAPRMRDLFTRPPTAIGCHVRAREYD